MPTDRAGNKITWKQFFKRWKQGIMGVTAYQQARLMYFTTYIILFGIVAGVVSISITAVDALWWLLIILIGALINTVVIQIGNYQKYQILKRLEDES